MSLIEGLDRLDKNIDVILSKLSRYERLAAEFIAAVDESMDIDDDGACTLDPDRILAVYEDAKQLQNRIDREE